MSGLTNAAMQARLDGQMAALRGAEARANPHPIGCSSATQWSRGWHEIKESKR